MKNFYITTSIAYTNAPPHIGFALELIQADVLARYHRLLGEDVFFLTGTDEHGLKIARSAEFIANKEPQEFVDEISEKFKNLTKVLNISNDDFIRTTDRKKHWPTVERVWRQLSEKGDIYKKKYKGLYCVGCEAFLKDKDLVDGKCPNHQKKPEIIEEENYFFKLSKYADQVKEEIEKDDKGNNGEGIKITPETRKNEILSFINQGVEDISVSRSKEKLKWGIPVPDDKSQVIYVWFEALLNYLYPKDRWPADVQCVGKDIFRFHALMWPAMLIALGLSRPKNILVHGFINVNGQKISKSLGNIVDPFDLVKKYGTDAVRYFLLREISPIEDGDFTYKKFEERYNADLAHGIGNLDSRIYPFINKHWNDIVPKINMSKTGKNKSYATHFPPGSSPQPKTIILRKRAKKEHIDQKRHIEKFEFNEGLFSISDFVNDWNLYYDYPDHRPYSSEFGKKGKEEINIFLYEMLESLRHIAIALFPYLPDTSKKIYEKLGLNIEDLEKKQLSELQKWGGLKPGTKIKKGEPLFPRI